jgi:hypothetical protein
VAGKVHENVDAVAFHPPRDLLGRPSRAVDPLDLVRKCTGRETSWMASYHAQRLAMRERKRQEAIRTAESAPAELLRARGADAPRPRAEVRFAQVLRVLNDMGVQVAEDDEERLGIPLDLDSFYRHARAPHTDARFRSTAQPTPAGRELLAAYYARKYGASVRLHDLESSRNELVGILPHLIFEERAKPGDVRSAHCFGRAHGCAVIYVREKGKEALLFFDSIEHPNNGHPLGVAIASQLERTFPNESIPVFEHFRSVQMDPHSCFTQTLKVAVTLTRRHRNADGTPGGFRIPGLLAQLRSRVLGRASLSEAQQARAAASHHLVRALPEIAKIVQSRRLLAEHAGGELGIPLMDSDDRETVQAFVERHTYRVEDEDATHAQALDYTRQKGDRYAEVIQIEAWIGRIEEFLAGAQRWDDARKLEFAQRMKALVRGGEAMPARSAPPSR